MSSAAASKRSASGSERISAANWLASRDPKPTPSPEAARPPPGIQQVHLLDIPGLKPKRFHLASCPSVFKALSLQG